MRETFSGGCVQDLFIDKLANCKSTVLKIRQNPIVKPSKIQNFPKKPQQCDYFIES